MILYFTALNILIYIAVHQNGFDFFLFYPEIWILLAKTSGFSARTISLALGRSLGSSDVQQQNN